jgi:signal peptidase I
MKKNHLIILCTYIGVSFFLYLSFHLVWIPVMLGIIIILFLAFHILNKENRWIKIIKYIVIFLFIFIGAICSRVLFFEIYSIPSSSMENTLMPGDVIIMNKISYGPRLPTSPFEIPWINIFFYLNENARKKLKNPWWEPKRLQGLTSIKANDIAMFYRYPDQKIPMIKRCVAIAGDTLVVNNAIINNIKQDEQVENILIPIELKFSQNKNFHLLDSVKAYSSGFNNTQHGNTKTRISQRGYEKLQEYIKDDILKISDPIPEYESWYMKGVNNSWGLHNFGPIIIPYVGFSIELNDSTFALYAETIKEFEKIDLQKRDNYYFLNGIPTTSFIFKQNYYFFMGDNREDSHDSRYFGFVPESNVIGKASYVLFSKNQEGIQYRRILKSL